MAKGRKKPTNAKKAAAEKRRAPARRKAAGKQKASARRKVAARKKPTTKPKELAKTKAPAKRKIATSSRSDRRVFSLEALDAHEGDALILHFGSIDNPRTALIDGGPAGVFVERVKPRFRELSGARDGRPLRLDFVMVSHVDADHVTGVVDLFEELRDAKEASEPTLAIVGDLWHNAFDNTSVAEIAEFVTTRLAERTTSDALPATLDSASPARLVIEASVQQGRRLSQLAPTVGAIVNPGTRDQLALVTPGRTLERSYGDLTLHFIAPARAELKKLENDWKKKLPNLRTKATPIALAEAAEYVDKSVYNLSSIVVLASCGGRRMLLTGDARGDLILQGLEGAGVLPKDGKVKIDLLKLPHHGSIRNVERDFFDRIVADHYVISANGRFDNPDKKTLEDLLAARGRDAFTLHLTNATGKGEYDARIKWLKQAVQKRAPRATLILRANDKPSVRIDLERETP